MKKEELLIEEKLREERKREKRNQKIEKLIDLIKRYNEIEDHDYQISKILRYYRSIFEDNYINDFIINDSLDFDFDNLDYFNLKNKMINIIKNNEKKRERFFNHILRLIELEKKDQEIENLKREIEEIKKDHFRESIIENEIIDNNFFILYRSLDFRSSEIENYLNMIDDKYHDEYRDELYHIKKLIEIYDKIYDEINRIEN